MNRLGYEHLQPGDNKGAVELMKLNATALSPFTERLRQPLRRLSRGWPEGFGASERKRRPSTFSPPNTTDPEDRRKAIKESAEQKLKQLGDCTAVSVP